MKRPLDQVQQESPNHLQRHLGLLERKADAKEISPDVLAMKVPGRTFLLACRGSGTSPSVALAIERLRAVPGVPRGVRLVAVPYMGSTGQELCARAGVGWLDLSGNAHIEAPGLRIHVEGKPNLFKRRGRPDNPFAPKSARVARHLLQHPNQAWLQRDLATATGLTPTYVSRVVRRLEELELLGRDEARRVRPKDPGFLLDAWAERYRFEGHQILRGHVSVPSPEALRQRIVESCREHELGYAFTALVAAWLRDSFARYRISTVYLSSPPSPQFLDTLAFEEGSRGANLWLVTPDDEGVFQDVEDVGGMACVSPVQTYLDLLHHAERARDAAKHLRERHLHWRAA